MNNLVPDLTNALAGHPVFLGLILIPIGLVLCFYGYRIFRLAIALLGFLFGFPLGMTVALQFTTGDLLVWAGGLGMGLLLAILSFAFYLAGVFLAGLVMGSALGYGVVLVLGDAVPVSLVVLLFAVVGGILAVILQRPLLILFTAFTGGWLTTTGLAMFVDPALHPLAVVAGSPDIAEPGPVGLGLLATWLFLVVAGTLVQFKVLKPKPKIPAVEGHNYSVAVPKRPHDDPEEESAKPERDV